jgi:hypothetical protein
MKKNLFAVLGAAALLFVSTVVFAGDPVPGIDVKVTNTATGAVMTTRTDANGLFSITLEQGKYTVCISHEACAKAINTKGTGAVVRSYSAGHFALELDNFTGIAFADLDGDGAAKSMNSPMKSPHLTLAVTEKWTATKPGFSATVSGREKHMTGHVTLIK